MKGCKSTLGTDSYTAESVEEDAHIVKILVDNGAIPFVKSNVPELCFTYHTSNNLFGTAENRWKRDRTCGGSTGGEAGLVSANISPFGVGSDTGGSIWVPANFCGVVGFMPTHKRVSTFGNRAYSGADHYSIEPVNVCVGPITRTVDNEILLMKILFET